MWAPPPPPDARAAPAAILSTSRPPRVPVLPRAGLHGRPRAGPAPARGGARARAAHVTRARALRPARAPRPQPSQRRPGGAPAPAKSGPGTHGHGDRTPCPQQGGGGDSASGLGGTHLLAFPPPRPWKGEWAYFRTRALRTLSGMKASPVVIRGTPAGHPASLVQMPFSSEPSDLPLPQSRVADPSPQGWAIPAAGCSSGGRAWRS